MSELLNLGLLVIDKIQRVFNDRRHQSVKLLKYHLHFLSKNFVRRPGES